MRESKDFDSYLQTVNPSFPVVKQENLNFKGKGVDKYDQKNLLQEIITVKLLIRVMNHILLPII